jgi:hypothetical protein
MRSRGFMLLMGFVIMLSGSILVVSSCGTKVDENTPTSTRYSCDGTINQCLKIKAGWTLDVRTTDPAIVDPSVIALPDGSFRIYANVYTGGAVAYPRHVISLISTDGGVTFTQEPGDRIVGDADHDAFGPVVLALPTGDFRMYLTDQRTVIGTSGAPAFISAISSDGLNFTWEAGERLHYSGTGDEASGIRGGNVVELPDGTYRMYYGANNKVLSAVSTDGLAFTRESGVRFDPLTTCPAGSRVNAKPYIDLAGTYHMFSALAVCDDMSHTNEKIGIFEGTSADGLTFTFSKTAIVQGYYIKSSYHGNPTDPFELPEDPMLVWTPAGLRMYFACGNSSASPPDARYYSVYNPSIH